jgi:hypothetical protein
MYRVSRFFDPFSREIEIHIEFENGTILPDAPTTIRFAYYATPDANYSSFLVCAGFRYAAMRSIVL